MAQNLVVVLTILKNDGVRQWEGWRPIYEMENDLKMFETTNQYNIDIYIYGYWDIDG